MKKIAVLFLIFVFSQLSADENIDSYTSFSFRQRLFYPQKVSKEINFLNLNPSFFNFDRNLFDITLHYEHYWNDSTKNRQQLSSGTRRNDVCGFITALILSTGSILYYSSMNSRERAVYDDAWKQQRNAEHMRQKFAGYNYRN